MKALGPASWGLSMALVERHQAGARSRRRGVGRSVSVRRERHRHRRRADSALGRSRRAAGASETDPRRRARSPGRRHPAQLRAARRAGQARDLALRAEPGARGPVAGAGVEGARQAAGRNRDGPARQRRREPRVVQHDRERHRADHAAAVHDDLHRRRPRAVRAGQAAPARQRRLRAQDSRST